VKKPTRLSLCVALTWMFACAPLEGEELTDDRSEADSPEAEQDAGAEDLPAPELGEHRQAIGSDILTPQCEDWGCTRELWAEPGHVHYVSTRGSASYLRIRYAPFGSGETQVDNWSGTFDLWGAQPGALYGFRAQGCWSGFFFPTYCGAYSQTAFVYVQAAGSRWTDSGLFSNPDFSWAFEGGWEDVPGVGRRKLQICSVPFQTGQLVGKLIGGLCYVAWGGREHALGGSMVLLSLANARWVGTSNGFIPANAVPAGFEGGTQFACRAWLNNGMHPGRTLGNACLVPWGGLEHVITNNYEVLTGG